MNMTTTDTTMKMTMVNSTKKMTTGLAETMKMMIKSSKRKGDTKKDDNDLHRHEDDNGHLHQEDDNGFGCDDQYDGQKKQKEDFMAMMNMIF